MGVVIVACILLIFKTEFQYKEGIFYGVLCAIFGTIFSVFNGKCLGKQAQEILFFMKYSQDGLFY
jgi:hypothetical protein